MAGRLFVQSENFAPDQCLEMFSATRKKQAAFVGPDYDLLVWGATGFTGRLIAKHLAKHGPPGLKWAVGGRRGAQLKGMMEFFASPAYPSPCAGVVIGDSQDPNACAKIAQCCRCVLSTTGPYTKVGKALVEACALKGTHYVDITGEAVPFVWESIKSNEELAKQTGAKIVHCAGFDSVPSDLLAALAIRALRSRHEQAPAKCVVACDALETWGGASGGTLASAAEVVSFASLRPRAAYRIVDSGALCAEPSGLWAVVKDLISLSLPGYDALLGAFHSPFVMASVNSKIVRRSRELLKDAPRDLVYKEVLTTGDSVVGVFLAFLVSFATMLAAMVAVVVPKRLITTVAPPGTGPSNAVLHAGKWRFRVAAKGSGGAVVKGEAVALDQDPGYLSTSRMAAETALCVLNDRSGMCGVLTPAVYWDRLPQRLEKFGMRFSIFDGDAPPPAPPPPKSKSSRRLLFVMLFFAAVLGLGAPEVLAFARFAPVLFAFVFGLIGCAVAAGATTAIPKTIAAIALGLIVGGLDAATLAVWSEPPGLSLEGQTWLVTEADSYLGWEVADQLKARGANVLLACRSVEACSKMEGVQVFTAGLDFNDLEVVDAFATAIGRTQEPLDGVVLSSPYAAKLLDKRAKTAQGLEHWFGNVHVATAFLIKELAPKLKSGGRVVVVASDAQHLALPFSGPDDSTCASTLACAYPRAALANLYYAWATTAQTLKKTTVVVVAPGGYGRNLPFTRPARVGVWPVLRAAVDDFDVVGGHLVDAMSAPRSFNSSCLLQGFKCDFEAALAVQSLTDKLILDFKKGKTNLRFDGRPPRASKRKSAQEIEAPVAASDNDFLSAAITAAALMAAGLFVSVAWKAQFRGTETPAPHGPTLNAINAFFHRPLVAPLFDGIVWSVGLAGCAVFAPVALLVGVVKFLFALFVAATAKNPDDDARLKAVVITGCDSGFGKALALKLCEKGYAVFAGCIGPPEALVDAARDLVTDLDHLPRAFKLDVTSDADVNAAKTRVRAWLNEDAARKLLAVVNNAGVATPGLLEWLPISDLTRDVQVNYLGVARVANAFLPLLRDKGVAKPRLVIVASMAGKNHSPVGGSYSAAKSAVLSYAGALRLEVAKFGIGVCAVLPSFHSTRMVHSVGESMDRVWAAAPPDVGAAYGGDPVFQQIKDFLVKTSSSQSWDPDRVTDTLVQVATMPTAPPAEVPVGLDSKTIMQVLCRLPPHLYDVLYKATLGQVLQASKS